MGITFGSLVKKYRDKKDFTQDELAEKLKISRITIAKIERGKQHPRLDTAVELANYLGFSLYELQESTKQNALGAVLERESGPKKKDLNKLIDDYKKK